MNTINRLAGAALGVHIADQIALVAVPLVAALTFNASAKVIGILVACQSMAYLLGSLPFGYLVDRAPLRWLVLGAALISLAGSLGIAATVLAQSLSGFGLMVTITGFGIVLFTLAALSIVPKAVPADRLSQANGTLELPRAVASFLIPLMVGFVITGTTAAWLFIGGAIGAVFAVVCAFTLPEFPRNTANRKGMVRGLVAGGRFVLHNTLLRAISICAIFWNLAFTALLVVMVPLLAEVYHLDPGTFGKALSAFGLAAILGSWTARQLGPDFPPAVLLVFGPAASVLSVVMLYLRPMGGSAGDIIVAFFLLGFGPSMWMVAQNSLRQLVTPSPMLGQVNAVIQTALYGVRPLGALLGGMVVAATSPQTGLLVVIAAYSASLFAALFSPLRQIRRYSDLPTP